jgi:type III secretion protein L
MTYTLFFPPSHAFIGTSKQVIKAEERREFAEAIALLDNVRALKISADADIAERQAVAAKEGRESGYAEVNDVVANAIAGFAAQIAAFEAERRDEIAGAAFAAVRAVIGDLDDESVLHGLVAASLGRIETSAPLTLEVAPAMLANVEARFAAHPNLVIRANDALGPRDCQLLSSQGRIVADLKLQLDALAERWGLDG